jgi:hypothetical protein
VQCVSIDSAAADRTRLTARSRPAARLSSAPEPALQVEHLRRGAQSDPQQRFLRQQRDVMGGSAIDLSEPIPPNFELQRRSSWCGKVRRSIRIGGADTK